MPGLQDYIVAFEEATRRERDLWAAVQARKPGDDENQIWAEWRQAVAESAAAGKALSDAMREAIARRTIEQLVSKLQKLDGP